DGAGRAVPGPRRLRMDGQQRTDRAGPLSASDRFPFRESDQSPFGKRGTESGTAGARIGSRRLTIGWCRKRENPGKTGAFEFSRTRARERDDPDGIRTRVAALKGPCPRPLDDGARPGQDRCILEDTPNLVKFAGVRAAPQCVVGLAFPSYNEARRTYRMRKDRYGQPKCDGIDRSQ